MKNPIERTWVRKISGKLYYRITKEIYWKLSRKNFSSLDPSFEAGHEIFSHKTILLRKLKDVDMYLQHNKVINLKLAVQNIDGLVIRPGERFSYWRAIGRPSRRQGYVEGMVLKDGKVIVGVGGGLCQLSNMLYWLSMHTPLTVIERWRHSYDVFPDASRTQPFGSGATCAFPYIDFQLENKTNQTFKLNVWLDDTYLHGKFTSNVPTINTYQVYEKTHQFSPLPWGGYMRSNTLYRKVKDKKTLLEVEDEFVVKNEAMTMYDPLIG
ncbi:MAG: VanW family protein [Candidatus Pacebacteria bacterium]|nr:VanW family protein [Candidatus Paceibacterota bacterium]